MSIKKFIIPLILSLSIGVTAEQSILGGALKAKDGKINIGATSYISTFNVNGGGYFNGNVTADTFIGNMTGTANNALTADYALDSDLLDAQSGAYYLDLTNATSTLNETKIDNLIARDAEVNTATSDLKTEILAITDVDIYLATTNLKSEFNVYSYTTDEASLQVGTASVALDSLLLNGQAGTYYNDLTNATNTLENARLPQNISITGIVTANSFVGSGSNLSGLNGDNISSGTVADARIASSIARDSEVATAVNNATVNLQADFDLQIYNATTNLKTELNTAGSLSNVAYENQINSFTEENNFQGINNGTYAITVNSLEVVGPDGEVNASAVEDKFLRNDGDDSTSGKLTAGGFATAATITANKFTDGTFSASSGVISGVTDLTVDQINANGKVITIADSSVTNAQIYGDANRTSDGQSLFLIGGKWNGAQVAAINYLAGDDTGNKDNGQLSFYTAPDSGSGIVERMRIDETGKVGIGTSSPSEKLHVDGTDNTKLKISSSADTPYVGLKLTGDEGGANEQSWLIQTDGSSDQNLYVRDSTAGANRIFIEAGSGEVGIGTDAPTYKLDVQSATDATLRARVYNSNSGTAANSALALGNNTSDTAAGLYLNSSTNTALGGAGALTVYQGTAAPISFFTDNVKRMAIESGGEVVVKNNTASSTSTLKIDTQTTNAGRPALKFMESGNDRMNIEYVTTGSTLVFEANPAGAMLQMDTNSGAIYTTPWQDYGGSSSVTGWSSRTQTEIYYMQIGKMVFVNFGINGTSDSTAISFTLPIAMQSDMDSVSSIIEGQDNGANVMGYCRINKNVSTTTVYCYKGTDTPVGAWTASGNKYVYGSFWYRAN